MKRLTSARARPRRSVNLTGDARAGEPPRGTMPLPTGTRRLGILLISAIPPRFNETELIGIEIHVEESASDIENYIEVLKKLRIII